MTLREKIDSKQSSMGSWISLGNADIAEIFSRSGLDWVVIDLEHSVIDISQAAGLIRTIDLSGAAPLVRLTSNNPDQIKRVMDAGAQGIIVPMVKSDVEARQAVSATRYEPLGTRGVGLARAQGYGAGFQDYLDWQTTSPVVIVQIEHIDAIENLDSILDVAGVDGLIIGPYDLSASMGIPGQFEHPDFISNIDKIRLSAGEKECVLGIHVVEPDHSLLTKAFDDGFNFVAFTVDIRILEKSMRDAVGVYKELVS